MSKARERDQKISMISYEAGYKQGWKTALKSTKSKVPNLTLKEWETIRHLLLHCGRSDHCGLTDKQVTNLWNNKLKLSELNEEHRAGGKFYREGS